jgi:predicted dinucleotide-binding enzyme
MPETPGKQVAVVGSGIVGQTLAKGLARYGYDVAIGSRDGKNIEGWDGRVGTFANTLERADIVVLALKGSVAEDVVHGLAPLLAGKIVIDVTNPISDAPPENGVLHFFTSLDDSLMERLQRAAPQARFVKAFSIVGSASMVNPDFGGLRPSMFIAGNDSAAKQQVSEILDQFGWETEDMGGAEAARAIEPLAILWCIPGFNRNEWTHAYKVLHR